MDNHAGIPGSVQGSLRHNGSMANIRELDVNGTRRRIDADAGRTLLSVLREDLDLTGTKYGCGEGQCAACTVLIDGQPARSCVTKVGAVAGKRIVTIEGLAPEGRLHPVQEAFLEADAMQCGYCTAGMILGAVALLRANPNPSDAEIVSGMNGHICRCGTYPRIVRAIHRAAGKGGRA
jgi:aerobic-type carbon monoxide dehydrogenase small subunit (CoxS/CutS family)